jgi:hypothetical protein
MYETAKNAEIAKEYDCLVCLAWRSSRLGGSIRVADESSKLLL